MEKKHNEHPELVKHYIPKGPSGLIGRRPTRDPNWKPPPPGISQHHTIHRGGATPMNPQQAKMLAAVMAKRRATRNK
jgi:hypothetical protein